MTPQDDLSPAASIPSAGPAPLHPSGSLPRSGLEQTVESLARELIAERRTERRWRIFFRLAWLGLLAALIWALMSGRNLHSTPTGPHTALVELRGEIAADSESSAEQMLSGLRSAFEDAGARAVVLRINSPGGSPVQAGIINAGSRR